MRKTLPLSITKLMYFAAVFLVSLSASQFLFYPQNVSAAATFTINIGDDFTGLGTITSDVAGINCPGDCSGTFPSGQPIKLTATPNADRSFDRWMNNQQSCAETTGGENYTTTCTITWPADTFGTTSLTTSWAYKNYTTNASVKGSGKGTISSTIGSPCSSSCTYPLQFRQSVTFTPVPDANSVFAGWGTDAEGGGLCVTFGGRGGTNTRGTSPTCQVTASYSASKHIGNVAAIFDAKPTAATNSAPATKTPTNAQAPATTPGAQASPSSETTTETAKSAEENSITINGIDNNQKSISIQSGKPIEFKGKTVPNGIVKLIVYSEPKEFTIKADNFGNWFYRVTGLESGDHRAEIEVTDPATGKTTARQEIARFSVAKAEGITNVSGENKNTNKNLLPIILIPAFILIIVAIAVLIRSKRKYTMGIRNMDK